MPAKLKINAGDRFGNLTVVKEVQQLVLPSGQTNRVFECICDCGNTTNVRLVHLYRGRIRTCGCAVTSSGKPKHHKHGTPLYTIWRGIKNRTSSPNYIDSHIYFYRNIDVFDEWKNDFELFYNWAISNGYKEGLQIDRKDNEKGYYPDNCRFCTAIEQANNKRNTIFVEYNGVNYPLSILLRSKNMMRQKQTIINRIKSGMNAQEAIDMGIKKGKYRTSKKEILSDIDYSREEINNKIGIYK